jgi:hypothetical protein
MEALVTDESDKSQLLRGKQLKGKWSINGVRWMNPMTWGQWRKICTSIYNKLSTKIIFRECKQALTSKAAAAKILEKCTRWDVFFSNNFFRIFFPGD